MKIKYAIMGSTLDPLYYDFWPIISKVWKEVFNITPVLGLICDENSDFIEDEYGLIKKIKSVEGTSDALQSQIVRFYLPTILDDICITSDIDMLPISKKYFIKDIEEFDSSKFYVMTSDNPECLRNKEYQMCYNLAHSEMFKKVLNIPSDWNELITFLNEKNEGLSREIIWTTDQRFLFEKINSFPEKEKLVLMNRGFGWLAHNRIDRASWKYEDSEVLNGNYIDSHLLRPYKQFKTEIDNLINLLYSP